MSRMKQSFTTSKAPLRLLISAIALVFVLIFVRFVVFPSVAVHPDTTTTSELIKALRTQEEGYEVLSDKVVYDGYARVYSRKVRFPDQKQFLFDVWGRVWKNDSFAVVIVVPFDRSTKTFTLIREYNIAHAKFVYSFPQGQVERQKHISLRDAAASELEEEAHLKCDEWDNLLSKDNQKGAPQDKYQRETVYYWLCTKAHKIDNSAKTDEEENIEIVRGVTAEQVGELIEAGEFQSNNIAAGLLSIRRLRRLRLLSCLA